MGKKAKNRVPVKSTAGINNKVAPATAAVSPKRVISRLTLCIILGILSLAIYANTLRNGYAHDDYSVITFNTLVNKGFSGIPELLATPHMKGVATDKNDTYRPLSLVMFAAENGLFGNNPAIGHFINILLFAGCVILLFLFLDLLTERKRTTLAFIAATLFAVHPIHTEVVANIKSRDELLCFFFAFSSLVCFLTYFSGGKKRQLIIGTTALFLSLLSKETSFSFFIIIPLIFFFYRSENKRRTYLIITVSAISLAAFFIVRAIVLHSIFPSGSISALHFMDNQLAVVPPGASRLATAIFASGYYIRLLFVPYPLICSYSYSTIPFVTFGNIWVLLSLAIYLLLAGVGSYRLIKFKNDLWAFGILFYLITIALFSNIVFFVPELVAERFVFFASAGFCLVIALIFEKWALGKGKLEPNGGQFSIFSKTKVVLALAAGVIVSGAMTVSRNKDWLNDYVLYKADLGKAPENARLCRDLGSVLSFNLGNKSLKPEIRARMTAQAIDYFQQAISIYPGYSTAQAELAQMFIATKNFDSAELHAAIAVSLDPGNALNSDCLGLAYLNTNRPSEALHFFLRVLELDPSLVAEYKNIARCYIELHQYGIAISYLKKASASLPDESKIINNQISFVFSQMGQPDSARKYELLAQ